MRDAGGRRGPPGPARWRATSASPTAPRRWPCSLYMVHDQFHAEKMGYLDEIALLLLCSAPKAPLSSCLPDFDNTRISSPTSYVSSVAHIFSSSTGNREMLSPARGLKATMWSSWGFFFHLRHLLPAPSRGSDSAPTRDPRRWPCSTWCPATLPASSVARRWATTTRWSCSVPRVPLRWCVGLPSLSEMYRSSLHPRARCACDLDLGLGRRGRGRGRPACSRTSCRRFRWSGSWPAGWPWRIR